MSQRLSHRGDGSALLGRTTECAELDELTAAVRRGESRALLLRGEAGIGKTALLEYAIDSAADMTIVRAVGVESEMELAYATLHQLCKPLLDQLERLPVPQRRALETVFGLSDGAVPDRFLVGLAVLSLFSEAADERPLLCVVDDAQWLDSASALTLAFVARRLLADPVGILFAARHAGEELAKLPEMEVHGLINGDARALLSSVVRVKLDEPVRDRIIAEMRGNPLGLLELPHGLTAAELVGGFGALEPQALTGRIEESFVRRIEALPADTRLLLLLAAAEPLGDPLLLWRAADALGIRPAAAGPAEAAELLAIGGRVMFRHPLVRSAVYRTAQVPERLAAHRALAEATDPVEDPDRRAWHLAAATAGPDERAALELERSAGRAQARGGLAATAAFLERAVALTEDPAQRPERALAAAQASLQAGAFEAALGLIAAAETGPLDEFQSARAALLRGHVAWASGLVSDAPLLLLNAARRLEPFDPGLVRETYLTAWGAAFTTAHVAGEGVLMEICRAVRALPPRPGDPSPLDLLLEGLALLTVEGHAAAAPTLQSAAKALTEIPLESVLRWGYVATGASTAVWDDEGFRKIAARMVELVREAGALAQLPLYLSQLGMARAWIGDFEGAASVVAETDSVEAATGSHFPAYAALMLRAMRGREAEAVEVIAGAVEQAAAGGQGVASHAHWAAAVLYNGLGRYDKAAAASRQAASNTFEPWFSTWALVELVEAAARVGDADPARDALRRLVATTQPAGSDWALAIEARSRALLSDGAAAEESYREAIDRLSRTKLRPELARAHLLYGEWLRRENRRVDARAQLRAAYEQFTSIGMEAFAERARMELLATGEKVKKRRLDTRDELTPQEWQIAQLAREGLSNREIGARLFLSHRTVESHLSKVFNKLGIRSRRELAGVDANRQ